MAKTIKEIYEEAESNADCPEKKAAYMIAASNLEIAKSNLMIAEANRSVATAIERAGDTIYKGLVHVSNSIDGISS